MPRRERPLLALRLAPAALALIVLGAHFYRAGSWLPVAIVVVLLALLPLRRPFVPWALQAALVVGALEWLRTLLALVDVRQAMGAPWARLAAILGLVALATLASALALRSRAARAHYAARAEPEWAASGPASPQGRNPALPTTK